MSRWNSTSPHSVPRRAFTLVEMMSVISIIMILASLFLGALWSAQESAKVRKTRALITKLHSRIMSKYEEYQTRRLPIQLGQIPGVDMQGDEVRLHIARRKMYATRELMRMEMPDRYSDLQFVPVALVNYDGTGAVPAYPYLWQTYRERVIESQMHRLGSNANFDNAALLTQQDHQSAECLYLIITYAVDDPALSAEHFTPNDFGDTDGDGMLEFIDAWGKPIWWLRWAPGFVSDMQPEFRLPIDPNVDPRVELFDSEFVKRMTDPNDDRYFIVRDAIRYNDPFNPLKVDRWEPKSIPRPAYHKRDWRYTGYPEYGFNTVPLIVSAGPDGVASPYLAEGMGLHFAFDYDPVPHPRFMNDAEMYSDPYTLWKTTGGLEVMRGTPKGDGRHLDNIHNHSIQAR